MTKRVPRSIHALLLFILIADLIPVSARADEIGQPNPYSLRETGAFGPIGEVYSSGAVTINGRSVQGEHLIWGGDLVKTLNGANATVLLDAVGQVTLENGATVRLSTKLAELEDNGKNHVLVASLVTGDITVRLNQQASAYIEAGGSTYATSRGAIFRIEIREGKTIIHETNGVVTPELQPRPPRIEPRTVNSRHIVIPTTPVKAKVKERSELRILWEKYYERPKNRLVSYITGARLISDQTTQPGEKVTNRVVRFRVEPAGIGQIVNAAGQVIDSAITDSTGTVTVIFQAGDRPNSGQIIANIDLDPSDIADGTTALEYRRDVVITKGGIPNRIKILMAVGAASLGGVLWCCVIRDPKRTPAQNPPPIVIP
jgi:hypothetical protein